MFSKKACAICCATTVGSAGAVALGKNKMGGGVAVGGNAFAFLQTKTMKQMEKAGAAAAPPHEDDYKWLTPTVMEMMCGEMFPFEAKDGLEPCSDTAKKSGKSGDWERNRSPSVDKFKTFLKMGNQLKADAEAGKITAERAAMLMRLRFFDNCCQHATPTAPPPPASPPIGASPASPKKKVAASASPGGLTPNSDSPTGVSRSPDSPIGASPASPVAVGDAAAPPKGPGAAVPPQGGDKGASCATPPKDAGAAVPPQGGGDSDTPPKDAGTAVPPQHGGEAPPKVGGGGAAAPNGAGKKDDGKNDGSSAC